MANTLISYAGADTYLNNDVQTNVVFTTKASGQLYINANCSNYFWQCRFNQNVFNNFLNLFNFDLVTNFFSAFNNCNLNYPFIIGENATNCRLMFNNCRNLNAPIKIGNNVLDCSEMFRNTTKLSQNIFFGKNVVNCSGMFQNSYFNHNITMPDSVLDCSNMFRDTYFNIADLHISNNASYLQNMFCNASLSILNMCIPASATNCHNMFANQTQIGGNIYINNGARGFSGLLVSRTNARRLNIYGSPETINTLMNTTIFNSYTSWTKSASGYYYNTSRNCYLYNNYQG